MQSSESSADGPSVRDRKAYAALAESLSPEVKARLEAKLAKAGIYLTERMRLNNQELRSWNLREIKDIEDAVALAESTGRNPEEMTLGEVVEWAIELQRERVIRGYVANTSNANDATVEQQDADSDYEDEERTVLSFSMDVPLADLKCAPDNQAGKVTYKEMMQETGASRTTLLRLVQRFGLKPIGKQKKRGNPQHEFDRALFLEAWSKYKAEQETSIRSDDTIEN